MPDLDGFATTKLIQRREYRLREEGKDIAPLPVVAVSAHELSLTQDNLRDVGFFGLCPKPVEPQLLMKMIADAVGIADTGHPTDISLLQSIPDWIRVLEEHLTRSDGQSNSCIIDVHELYKRFSGDQEIVIDAMSAFTEEISSLLSGLEHAVNSNDRSAIKKRAHALKGAYANSAMKHGREICSLIERDSEILSLDAVKALFSKLNSETGVALTAVTNGLQALGVGPVENGIHS
jgi:two-component system sensor histidine kinase TorS